MSISIKILRLIVLLLGRLSLEDMSKFLGESNAKRLQDWYFEVRSDDYAD